MICLTKLTKIFLGVACCTGIVLASIFFFPTAKESVSKLLPVKPFKVFREDFISLINNQTHQSDEHLINFVRNYIIQAPSSLPYNFSTPLRTSKPVPVYLAESFEKAWATALALVELYLPKRRRTFFECGGSDGEYQSTTVYLEQFLNWTGIIVEGDPHYFQKLSRINRKAFIGNACIGSETYPYLAKFQHEGERTVLFNHRKKLKEIVDNPGRGHIIQNKLGYHIRGNNGNVEVFDSQKNLLGVRFRQEIEVLCIPVYTLMMASNLTTIDLLIVDFHENAVEILATIPFESVDIGVLTIRYSHRAGLERLKRFLRPKGYLLFETRYVMEFIGSAIFVNLKYVKDVEDGTSKHEVFDY